VKIEVELLVSMGELVDMNLLHLSTTLALIAESYKSMEAYGNHYRVDDASSKKLVSFDSGVACIFKEEGRSNAQGANPIMLHIQYVGVIKEILQLDYGPL
jgi:hypothetical protein